MNGLDTHFWNSLRITYSPNYSLDVNGPYDNKTGTRSNLCPFKRDSTVMDFGIQNLVLIKDVPV